VVTGDAAVRLRGVSGPFRRWCGRALVAGVVVAGTAIGTAGTAVGQSLDVAVQTAKVSIVDGKGTVAISNLTDRVISVTSAKDGNGCSYLDPPAQPLPPGERTQVALTTKCQPSAKTPVTFTFSSGVNPHSVNVSVQPGDTNNPHWQALFWWYLIALFFAVGCVAAVCCRLAQFNAAHGTSKKIPLGMTKADKKTTNLCTPKHKERLWWKSGLFENHQPWPDDSDKAKCTKETCFYLYDSPRPGGGDTEKMKEWEKGRKGHFVDWREDLPGLGTSWSFKDAWVANATLASSLLVALLAGSDLLNNQLGDKGKALLTLLAVSSALAALLVGIGPLILKAVGRKVEMPTVGGMFLAAGLSMVGVLGQIGLVTWEVSWLLSPLPRVVVWLVGAMTAGLAVTYAVRAMEFNLCIGLPEPPIPPRVEDVVKESVAALASKADTLLAAIRSLQPASSVGIGNGKPGPAGEEAEQNGKMISSEITRRLPGQQMPLRSGTI
jgi:hypothetical protein